MIIHAFLPFLWAALYSCGDLPHRTCSYSDTDWDSIKGTSLSCYKVDLNIPDNFDVNLIAEDVRLLYLNCPLSMPWGYDDNDYCNTLRQNCTPVPFRAQLSKVRLIGFQTDHGRLPVAKFLENAKLTLDSLYIHSCKIESLDADFLRGFQNLTLLWLRGNDIETLDVNTFQSLVPLSGQAIASPTKPKLREIVLEKNKLQQLDWSVFRPLADCVRNIDIELQRPGLRTLLMSGSNFNLTKLAKVSFRDNKLTTMPKEILQTIAIHPDFAISMADNNMCSKEDCSCCEMKDFMRWGQNYLATAQSMTAGHAGVYVRFTCGGMYSYNPMEYTMDRYQNS